MSNVIVRNWWAPVVRGIVAIIFGIFAFATPGITLAALVIMYGAFAFVDGVFALSALVFNRGRKTMSETTSPWWALLLQGIFGIAAGLYTFYRPGITTFILLYLIAGYAFVSGILLIITAIRLRKEIEGEWLMGLSGVLSILFGVAMFAYPGAGALAVIWLIGIYAMVFGITMISLGFKLKKLGVAEEGTPTGEGLAYR